MLVLRGRIINLLLTLGRSRRLLLCADLKDRVVATKSKVNMTPQIPGIKIYLFFYFLFLWLLDKSVAMEKSIS